MSSPPTRDELQLSAGRSFTSDCAAGSRSYVPKTASTELRRKWARIENGIVGGALSQSRGSCGNAGRCLGFWTRAARTERPFPEGQWRRERDSNPRYGCPYTRFPSVRL